MPRSGQRGTPLVTGIFKRLSGKGIVRSRQFEVAQLLGKHVIVCCQMMPNRFNRLQQRQLLLEQRLA